MRNKKKRDIPTVIFDSTKTQIEIAEWLGVVDRSLYYSAKNDLLSKLKRKIVAFKTSKETATNFGLVLRQMGISPTETCLIAKTRAKSWNAGYKIHFSNRDDDGSINLIAEDFVDQTSRITFDYRGRFYSYDYDQTADMANSVSLSRQETESVHDEFTHKSETTSNGIELCISNDLIEFRLNIVKSATITKAKTPLLNTDHLESYLQRLSFPIEIDEVYAKVCEILYINPYDYYKIRLETIEDGITTNKIELRNGILKEFKMTKNGRRIVVNRDGSYSWINLEKRYPDEEIPRPSKSVDEEVDKALTISKAHLPINPYL